MLLWVHSSFEVLKYLGVAWIFWIIPTDSKFQKLFLEWNWNEFEVTLKLLQRNFYVGVFT